MQQVPTQTFKAGEVIFKEGDPPGAVYIIISGEVEVFKEHEGESAAVAILDRDSVFGDMSLISQAPRSASVRALSDTECFVVGLEEYQTILKTTHPLIQTILKILSGRLRSMTQSLAGA